MRHVPVESAEICDRTGNERKWSGGKFADGAVGAGTEGMELIGGRSAVRRKGLHVGNREGSVGGGLDPELIGIRLKLPIVVSVLGSGLGRGKSNPRACGVCLRPQGIRDNEPAADGGTLAFRLINAVG